MPRRSRPASRARPNPSQSTNRRAPVKVLHSDSSSSSDETSELNIDHADAGLEDRGGDLSQDEDEEPDVPRVAQWVADEELDPENEDQRSENSDLFETEHEAGTPDLVRFYCCSSQLCRCL